jgi:hypothetical protein
MNAINLAGTITGNLNNSGLISANGGPAINLVSGVIGGNLTNTSTILTLSALPAIVLDSGSKIIGGIINSGAITSTLGTLAVDLSSSLNSVKFVNNTGGVVTGGIDLSQVAHNLDTVFQMNGGTISGVVAAAGGTGPSTLNIAGGSLPGGILLSDKPDVINQLGGQIASITGTSGANQVLNVLGHITTAGPITNVDNIAVPTNGQLIIDDAISGLKNLALGANPLSLPNVIDNTNFIMDPGTTLAVALQDVNTFGHMLLNGTTNTLNNVNLLVSLVPNNGLNIGDELQVLESTLGNITGNVNLILPPGTLLFGIKNTVDGILNLPYLTLVVERILQSPLNIPGLVNVLDQLLNEIGLGTLINTDLLSFISNLNKVTDPDEINNSLSSMAPPHNGGMPDLAQRSFRNVLDGIFDHLYYRDCCLPTNCPRSYECYPAGVWTRVVGDTAHQQRVEGERGTSGYHARSAGVIIGYDAFCNKGMIAGAALSYSAGEVNTHCPARQNEKLWSYQLTGYLTKDWGCCAPVYVDLAAAVAYDGWNSRRDIIAGHFRNQAHADFGSWQYGADLETGYRFSFGRCNQYQAIPLVKLRYSNLDINHYDEAGTDLALSIHNDNVGEFLTGGGLKFRKINRTLIPELRFNVGYDWIADPQTTTASFITGGDCFTTYGFDVEPWIYNVGISLGGELCRNLILELSYDADFKSHYFGQAGSIKFKYAF